MPLMDIKQKGIAAGSMRKSPGKGPERLLWGSIIICLHCYPVPWMFAVAACDKENTGPDGPSVWLCIVIVMFLTSLYISPWRWQKGHTFCPVESSLKQVKGKQKKMLMEIQTGSTLQTQRHRLVPAELLVFMLHGTWKGPLLPAAKAQMQTDNEMISFYFFFPPGKMANPMLIFWKLGHTSAVATQQWARSVTDSNSH